MRVAAVPEPFFVGFDAAEAADDGDDDVVTLVEYSGGTGAMLDSTERPRRGTAATTLPRSATEVAAANVVDLFEFHAAREPRTLNEVAGLLRDAFGPRLFANCRRDGVS